MPLQRLDEAFGVGRRAEGERRVLRTYKWMQFRGKEEVTDFDEAHFATEGIFSQNSSEGHKEYQDRLRSIHLRKEGMEKAAIAKALGRSERFVAKWWQKEPKEIPRPWGVHEYLTKDMGRNARGVGSTNGATMTDESAADVATWWRDVEVKRKFADDPVIYEEILNNTDWKPNNARTRDFATGAYHLKYDQRGNIRWEGHQAGKYKPGLSPAMDKAIQKLFVEYGIADRTSGIITNWYPDGQGYLGSHRHDCWTALFSFGHERILTIDNTPLLMQDGDLCIFGTQRHGVPVMPEISDGRITLVVFFYPNEMQKKGMWQTITDPETMEASPALGRMLHDRHLGAQAEKGSWDKELLALQQLGFARADALVALQGSHGDVDKAAELLLMSGAVPEEASPETGRWKSEGHSTSSASTAIGTASSSSEAPEDEQLARQLLEVPMSDAEVAALAMQLEELEGPREWDPSLLAAQFQEYEEKFTLEDAERWNGHGDLMHSPFSREHLSLEKMDPVTLYSVGHGDMLEKDFWEMLQCHSIRVLYDIRPTDHRGELFARHQRFNVQALRSQCRARGIFFKPMPVGRESAYGTLAHIRSDEGRHTLVELAWQAKRKRTAFMGSEELWQDDNRQVVAEELVKAGHLVEHVRTDGSTEKHLTVQYPDWLLREEDRLRLLEKKRQAGEANTTVHKSRLERSSEAVAARLARPVEELDAMTELRNAANQTELVVAQRKLARYQRLAEEKGLLANKVLKNVPEWVREDAMKQAEWVAAKKKEKAEQAAGANGKGEDKTSESPAGSSPAEPEPDTQAPAREPEAEERPRRGRWARHREV
ncbi:unnamed protein product [Effrenium voratum]|nr:unnamed protein product [Effrenium voratum]